MFEKATEQEMSSAIRNGAKRKWPLHEMEVGDAVTIKAGEFGKTSPQIYAHGYGHKSGKVFSTRLLPDGSYRIWRRE